MTHEWTVTAIIGLIALLITVAGVYATWVLKVNRGEQADSAAQKAHNRIDTLAQMFNDFRQEVARDYASNRMIEQMEARLVIAIERLGDRLDRAFDTRIP